MDFNSSSILATIAYFVLAGIGIASGLLVVVLGISLGAILVRGLVSLVSSGVKKLKKPKAEVPVQPPA